MPAQYAYREIQPADAAFLTEMLRLALGWRIVPTQDGAPPPVAVPLHVFADLGRPGDGGIVATYDGEPAGACWYRLFPGGGRAADAEAVPQLTIAVLPQFRAQGVGGALLDACIELARRGGHPAIDLLAEVDNPARAMYERRGFVAAPPPDGPQMMRKPLRRQNAVASASG